LPLDHTKPLPFIGLSNGYIGLWAKPKKPLHVAKATAVDGTQIKPLPLDTGTVFWLLATVFDCGLNLKML
jgi:hypothetical protein